jgi:hypothetical protein
VKFKKILNTKTLKAIGSAYNDRYAIAFAFSDGTAFLSWNTEPPESNAPDYNRTAVEITDTPIPTTGRQAIANRDLDDLLSDLSEGRPHLVNPDVIVEEIAPHVVAELFEKHATTPA